MGAYHTDLTLTGHATRGAFLYQPTTAERRMIITECMMGFSGTPADAAALIKMQRSTTAPTGGTGKTPQAHDTSDAAADGLGMDGDATTNGTLTANAFALTVAMNQRATMRWVAREGEEVIIPLSNNNGVGLITPTGPTVTVNYGVKHKE